jgi:hypothetical protein
MTTDQFKSKGFAIDFAHKKLSLPNEACPGRCAPLDDEVFEVHHRHADRATFLFWARQNR